jgi:predicted AlkP superfamily phosphohydrolase/phosphomutase
LLGRLNELEKNLKTKLHRLRDKNKEIMTDELVKIKDINSQAKKAKVSIICFVSLSVSFNTVVFEPAQSISKATTSLHDLWPSAKHARHKMMSWCASHHRSLKATKSHRLLDINLLTEFPFSISTNQFCDQHFQ